MKKLIAHIKTINAKLNTLLYSVSVNKISQICLVDSCPKNYSI